MLTHTIHVCLFFLLAPLLHAEQGFGSACPRCFIVLVCVRACMHVCARTRERLLFCACEPAFIPSLSRDAAISGPQFFQENKDERELGLLLYSCSLVGLCEKLMGRQRPVPLRVQGIGGSQPAQNLGPVKVTARSLLGASGI